MTRRMSRILAATVALGFTWSAGAAIGAPAAMLKQFKVPTANSDPFAVTNGSDGNRWFTEGNDLTGSPAKIARITPAGAITEFPAGVAAGCNVCILHDIAQGPGSILYITSNGSNLMRFNETTQSFQSAVDVAPTGAFNNLAVGGGNVWITDFNTNVVWRYTIATGVITNFPAHTPIDVAVDASGNAWFTENFNNADGTSNIGRIGVNASSTDPVTYTKIPAPAGSITVAPNGKVWFGEAFGPAVGLFDPAGAAIVTMFPVPAPPAGIAVAPDGTIWFTQNSKGNIASITEADVITEDKVVKGSGPLGITVAPNGNPWYTMQGANKIATLQLG
ncbi:MAG: virginiamycin lyase [Nocardioidaceae bacterium]|nr:virginiamycin lyase [Nocardioidaceae bacterium]